MTGTVGGGDARVVAASVRGGGSRGRTSSAAECIASVISIRVSRARGAGRRPFARRRRRRRESLSASDEQLARGNGAK
jgi:hypothetical protein